jgi:signal transduction histidine kinase
LIIAGKTGTLYYVKQKTSPTQKALNLWAVVLIIWAFYRAWFKTSLPIWVDEFIAKPIVFILPVYLYIRYSEKKNFFEALGLKKVSTQNLVYIVGAIIGCLFFLIALRRYANLPSTLTTTHFIYLFAIMTMIAVPAFAEQGEGSPNRAPADAGEQKVFTQDYLESVKDERAINQAQSEADIKAHDEYLRHIQRSEHLR